MNDFLQKVLPWLGAAATGGVPALVVMAAKTVSEALGADIKPEAGAIASAVAGATPEQIAALKDKDNEFMLRMQALGFQNTQEMAKLALQADAATMADVQDARAKHAQNANVFRLGVVILLTFAIMVALSLWGSYLLLSGGITVKDVGIVAAVFGFLGSLVGYAAANAQQVVSFFFGSSKGSSDKTDTLAKALAALGNSTKK